ncbi:hypothetical protein GQ600_15596 [Phytophthora cactorum]|nr:hypothetical protein GQ600_15596 [Phytophthora cactorum]
MYSSAMTTHEYRTGIACSSSNDESRSLYNLLQSDQAQALKTFKFRANHLYDCIAAKDLNPSTERTKLSDAVKANGGNNRLLRSREMDSEERMMALSALENWYSNLLGKSFQDATDWVWSKNIDSFIQMKKSGTTPESLYGALNIAQKEATMTKKALKNDADFLLYSAFKHFWELKK